MPDDLTQQFKAELKRRGITASNTEVSNFISQRPDLFQSVGQPMTGMEPRTYEPSPELKGGPIHAVGATLWHGIDTALFSVPSQALGEKAPYRPETLGGGAKAGSVFGQALGFMVGFGKLKAGLAPLAAVGKYGTKARRAASVKSGQKIYRELAGSPEKIGQGFVSDRQVGRAIDRIIKSRPAKTILPRYQISTAQVDQAGKQMDALIRAGLKKEFPNLADDVISRVSKTAIEELGRHGTHLNTIASKVERVLGTKFGTADKSLINAYISRAAEMTVDFSIYNLIDDGIKSAMVEGHEFDPVSDVGHALMFSAFLPGIEAIPNIGKTGLNKGIFKSRAIVKKGIEKIKATDYNNMSVEEINTLFKIVSNNNTLKNSEFAKAAARNFGNEFTEKQHKLAVKHMKSMMSKIKPDRLMNDYYREAGKDIINSLPRMTVGALFFNAATIMDSNILRNIDPEEFGAHLLTGALFTKRYKPIRKNTMPTLTEFDRKVELLNYMGMDASQLRLLGRIYDARHDAAMASTGLVTDRVGRQVMEAFNTTENVKQTKDGKGGIGRLDGANHSFIVKANELYLEMERTRKILNKDDDISPDVTVNRLTRDQLLILDKKLREISINEKDLGEKLTESNFERVQTEMYDRINDGNLQLTLGMVAEGLRVLGLRADVPSTAFDMNRPLSVKWLKGLRQFEAKEQYDSLHEFERALFRLEAYRLVDIQRERPGESKQASEVNIKEAGPAIREVLKEYERKITEDNYEEGAYIPHFDTANNAFIRSLGNLKLNKTYNALYDIVEGRTDRLSDADGALAERLYTLLPPGTEIKDIKRGDIEKEQWKKTERSEDYQDYINTINSISEILNIAHQGKKKAKNIEYSEVKDIVNDLRAAGFKLGPESVDPFKKFHIKRLTNSADISTRHIAMIQEGISQNLFKIVTEKGQRIAKGPDMEAARAILKPGSKNEAEYFEELSKYEAIMNELKVVNNNFLRFSPEYDFGVTNANNLRVFINSTYPITTKFTRNIPEQYETIRKSSQDKLEILDTVREVIDGYVDFTDPELLKAKELTIEDANNLSSSLVKLVRDSQDNFSPELKKLIKDLESALSLTRVGERGIAEVNNEQAGDRILAIKNAIESELDPHFVINDQMSTIILGLETNTGDKINGKLRHDNLLADLTEQLKKGGIEVTDGLSIGDLHTKYFNSHLTLNEKMEKGITLSLRDFVETINDHMMSWNKGYTQESWKDMVDRQKKMLEDSSMKSRNTDYFSKLNVTVNKLKPYMSYFDSAKFSTEKEQLSRYIETGKKDKALEILNKISEQVELGYNKLHGVETAKDTNKEKLQNESRKDYLEFLERDFKELLFGVSGTTTRRTVSITHDSGKYMLIEGKMIMSDGKLAELMTRFEKEGLYIASLDKTAVILDEFGRPRKVSNIYGYENIDGRFIKDAEFSASMQSGKERKVNPKNFQSPEGINFIRIPVSFNTQLVIPKNTVDFNKATTVVQEWYNNKLAQLEKADRDGIDLGVKGISTKAIIENFKKLYGTRVEHDVQLKQFIKAMYHDKMNSKGFHTLLTLATNRDALNEHMASDYKYFSLSEGVGTGISGSTKAMEMLKESNEKGVNKKKLISAEELESIDYYLDKGNLEVAVIADEAGLMDALKLAESGYGEVKGVSQKDIDYTLNRLKNDNGDSSLKARSTVDGLQYAGTNAWRLFLIQKARKENDGVGGIKEKIGYNDGINTALLKQNTIFDPRIARVMDALGIDILSFDSSAKVWSRESIGLKESWETNKKPLDEYFESALGKEKDAQSLRDNNYIQEIKLEDIQFVKSEDRHTATNITYALSETLNKMGFKSFIDYAGYNTRLNAADLMREGIVSKGPERYSVAEFVLNTLAEEGALLTGTTTSDVQAAIKGGIDPRQEIVREPINRVMYRRIIERMRNPETTGASYSVMIPFLRGSLPVYSEQVPGKKSVQIQFGGKKLASADGDIRITDFNQMQYVISLKGREVLVGKQDNKWTSVGTSKEQLELTSSQKKEISKQTARIDNVIKKYRNGTTIRNLHNELKNYNIFLESASLRMPNLSGDVVINKIEGFYEPAMGNVVGINPVELSTKMQADMDGDMSFNYHNMRMELTKALADISPLKFDTYIYEQASYDMGDIFQNGGKGYDSPVGSKTDAVEPMDAHNVNYHKGKDYFGQIKRFSAGINSLARTQFNQEILRIEGERQTRDLESLISFDNIETLQGFLQRDSNVLQSLIDTTKRPNMTNLHRVQDLKRFILFGDIPGDIEFNPAKYGESGYTGIVNLERYAGVQKDIMKDAVIEIVDALGRPSRIMSDLQDASGRRAPDHVDLIRMKYELDRIEADPSQYVFNKLVRRYDKEKRDELLKLFFEKGKDEPLDYLRDRILKNQFGRGKFNKQVMVEKRPFSFDNKKDSLFDSTPGGYLLKRLGNVNDTYRKTSTSYSVQTKELGQVLPNIENFIALSDAKTHTEIKDTLAAADAEGNLTLAFTGNKSFNTGITDIKYLENYSVKYYMLGQESSNLRNYLRRNGKSNSDNVIYIQDKLRRIEGIRAYMRSKEDGLVGQLLQSSKKKRKELDKPTQKLLDHFKLSSVNVKSRKGLLYRNTTNEVQYIYTKHPTEKGQYLKTKRILPKSTYFLYRGNHVVLKNPIRFDPISKAETLDAYSLLLSGAGNVTAENIRGFSGKANDTVNFIVKSRMLKAQMSALSAEAFKISEGHPEGKENWVIEKEAENTLVTRFFERWAPGYESTANQNRDITRAEYRNTIHDIALYLIKPDNVFGKVAYIQDRNVALPSFKINKRVVNAVLRYLRNEGHEDIYKDIVGKWGTQFKRRYSNVPDAEYSSMFQDSFRSNNKRITEKSEVYNLLMEKAPSMLYRPAVIEALKDEISIGSSKITTERDINGDMYKILRLGTYENIEATLSPYVDAKSTEPVSNLYC